MAELNKNVEYAQGSAGISELPPAGVSFKVTKPREFKDIMDEQIAEPVVPENPHAQVVTEGLSAGYSAPDVSRFLQESQGLQPEDADYQLVDSVAQKIKNVMTKGVSEEQVREDLTNRKYDPFVIEQAIKVARVSDTYKNYEVKQSDQMDTAQDIVTQYKNIHEKYMGQDLYTPSVKGVDASITSDINILNTGAIDALKKAGFDAYINPNVPEEILYKDENGTEHLVDSSFIKGLQSSKNELAGSVIGGFSGAIKGAAVGARAGRVGAIVGGIAGGLLGGAAGAAGGKALDMAYNATLLKEDLSIKAYQQQMLAAGIFDGIAAIVGGTVLKVGGKAITTAYKRYLSGNIDGAIRAMKDNLNITDEQIKEITELFESMLNKPMTTKGFFGKERLMTEQEKQLVAVHATQQGGTAKVAVAAAQNARLAHIIKSDIDKRAKGLREAINSVWDSNTGMEVRKGLEAYQKDVKDYYGSVKQHAADAIDGTDFRFDLKKLAIKPVIDNIGKKVQNPRVQEQFVLFATRIANATKNRTFSGLVDLRQAVNEFKYGKNELSKPDSEALNIVINKIDEQIAKAAKTYMPEGKQWLENFATAKDQYRDMLLMEDNAIYKAVVNENATEESIQKALSKYATTNHVDFRTYAEVIIRLPFKLQAKVEAAAIKNLINRHTYGKDTDLQAVHFPELAADIDNLLVGQFKNKQLVNIIKDMAKVFKNDADLSGIKIGTGINQMQSAMSADLLAKVKYGLMTRIFNSLVKFAPTESARNIALVDQLDRLLRNPLNAKTANDFFKLVPEGDKQEVLTLMKDLQIQVTKQGTKQEDFVNMYQRSTSGEVKETNGILGKGTYLVKKVIKPAEGTKVAKHEVNMSRLATLKDISGLVGKEVTEKDLKTIPKGMEPSEFKAWRDKIYQQLQEQKFTGLNLEDKVMLFPETVIKPPKKGKK